MTIGKSWFCSMTILVVACGGDGGSGTATFTTWGEGFIEQGIPAGGVGFADGWHVTFAKFLISFQNIQVADVRGQLGALHAGSFLVEQVAPGPKTLIAFPDLAAQSWPQVSFEVAPTRADAALVASTATDRDFMVQNGYALFVEGVGRKSGPSGVTMQKTFRWGFRQHSRYGACAPADTAGSALEGIVIADGANDVSELTVHADHLFYDRLAASPDAAAQTLLRFEEKAAADRDQDGEITLQELETTPLDVALYDPSGFAVTTLGGFMAALVRTVPHFRGEGECDVTPL